MIDNNDDARSDQPGIIKIIGIGQSLRGDDGAGLAAVRLWQETHQNGRLGIEVELTEMPGIGLLNLVDGARYVILVDAVRSGARAGTVHVLSEAQLDVFGTDSRSAHGLGVAETLALGRMVLPSQMPEKLVLVGIEASDVSIGECLSVEVTRALPEVAHLIDLLLDESLSTNNS